MSGDFGSMQTRVADDLGRLDLATSLLDGVTTPIKNAIQDAIIHYQGERFWFNETRATTVTVAQTANYALPSDCLDLDKPSITVNSKRYPLEITQWDEIDNLIGVTAGTYGQPLLYGTYQQQLWLYPVPDTVYTITLPYLKKLATLSGSTDTNAWMVEAEPLIRQRAKVILLISNIKDSDQAGKEAALEQDILEKMRAKTDRLLSTGRIRPSAF